MKTTFSDKTVPLVIVATCVVSFGLLLPLLGYYLDDWHHIYYGYSRGLAGLWELFLYDSRPYATLFYSIGFSLLGYKALHWQIAILILRSLTVLVSWLYLKELWPSHKREITWVALLFAVYPLFKQQALSVAYSLHWTGYLLYSISIWAMVQSIRKPKRFWPFMILAVITCGLHLIIIEYFSGIELIRPIFIWLILSESIKPISKRITKVIILWLPYLLVLIAFAIYRVYLMPRPEAGIDRNIPILIFEFFKTPLETSIQFIQGAIQDTIAMLFSVWHQVINPELFEISIPANIAAITMAVLTGIGLFIYLTNLKFKDEEGRLPDEGWYKSALVVGIILTILGALPAWITDQHITTDNPLWSDRYGLASMLGTSLLIVAALEGLINNKKSGAIVLCTLIALSISWHFLNTNSYRWSWIKQSQFYNQLYWRAPYIEPNTAILSDSEIFPHMTEVSSSFAISTLYPKLEDSRALNYWFFNVSRRFTDNLEELLNGTALKYSRFFSEFSGDSRNSLVILYEPEISQCLWVLRPEDRDIRVLPQITRDITVISNIERIKINSSNERARPDQIFGSEAEHTWCYYFQKGDLARQFQDWDQVVTLWNMALENGYSPGNGVEFIPFIEGFARTGEWDTAEELTYLAHSETRMMSPVLCSTWQRIEKETATSETRDEALNNIYEKLNCPKD